jgi:hypothetical protein
MGTSFYFDAGRSNPAWPRVTVIKLKWERFRKASQALAAEV